MNTMTLLAYQVVNNDAATDRARTELEKTHGKRGATAELVALVNAAVALRGDPRSPADLAVEFGVSEESVRGLVNCA